MIEKRRGDWEDYEKVSTASCGIYTLTLNGVIRLIHNLYFHDSKRICHPKPTN